VAATASPATAGRKTQALALSDYAGLVSRFTAAHHKRAGRARARDAPRDERGRFLAGIPVSGGY